MMKRYKIRKGFDQYVNIRPIVLLEGAPCPLKDISRKQLDMLIIRENSEGEYAGAGDWLFKGTGVFSRKGTERIIRYAYETARSLGKSLTSIIKANALQYGSKVVNAGYGRNGYNARSRPRNPEPTKKSNIQIRGGRI